jgi:hypothetical protein
VPERLNKAKALGAIPINFEEGDQWPIRSS